MKPKAKEIAYGISKEFINGPINTRCGKYITNGVWLIEEKYAPKELLALKYKTKLKHKPKKSVVKEILKNASQSQECILIGKQTKDAINEKHNVIKMTSYKYTFYKYVTPKSKIKRRKRRISREVSIQAKFVDYFKSLIKIRMGGFSLRAYAPEEQVYMYSGKNLIGVIMPLRNTKRIIKRRKKLSIPTFDERLKDVGDDIPF